MNEPRPIPLLPPDIEQPTDLVAAIRTRRGGELLKLDRMLLHSPALAYGWNVYLGKVRGELSVPARLKELAMCVVAVLNGAHYEYEHHAPLYIQEGASAEQAQAILEMERANFPLGLFPEEDQDVLALARAMTRDILVPGSLKRRLVKRHGPQQVVELVAVVATYNMVSRFLVALDIHTEYDEE